MNQYVRVKYSSLIGLALLLSFILSACGRPTENIGTAETAIPATSTTIAGQPTGGSAPARKLNVVTTVAPLNNLALNVGGNRVELLQLIPDGTDSHTFEPAASDARRLNSADLIIVNGVGLETPAIRLAEASKKKDAVILKLADNTITDKEWVFDFSFPKEKGEPNPHLWMNPDYARKYAQLIEAELVRLDPNGKTYYEANLRVLSERIEQMDRAMAAALATVPEKNRKLVTYHDSFAYWAPRYKWTVIGAVQPSDFKEPSGKEIAEVIEQLKREQVPAIFGSEVFPSRVLEQIAREAGVKFYDTLRDDALPGPADAPEHTYVGMQIVNTITLVRALGGQPGNLKEFNTSNTYQK